MIEHRGPAKWEQTEPPSIGANENGYGFLLTRPAKSTTLGVT
jgi:hypothetical protein